MVQGQRLYEAVSLFILLLLFSPAPLLKLLYFHAIPYSSAVTGILRPTRPTFPTFLFSGKKEGCHF